VGHCSLAGLTRRALVSALLLSAACSAAPEPEAPAPSPSPTAPAAGPKATAERITSESQLLGGSLAKGRLGDYRLANAHLAVVIGAEAHGEGYSPYGGGILDAAVPGGVTRFGEILMTFDLQVIRPTELVIVHDGSDGRAAVLEARGVEARLPLLEALLPDYAVGEPRSLAVTVRYTLEPDARVLLVDYELTNTGRETAQILLGVVGFLFGDGAEPFVPGYGYAAPPPGSTAPYYGAVGEDVGYLFGRKSTTLNFLVEYSGILAAQHSGELDIAPGVTKRLGYALVVGPGDLSALQATWREALAPDMTGHITGRVIDGLGRPIAGAAVHATESDARERERDYVTGTRTSTRGTYTLEVTRGRYDVVVSAPGGLVTDAKTVRLDDPMRPIDLEFIVATSGVLEYRVRDEGGRALPAKLTIIKKVGSAARLPARYGEPPSMDGVWRLEHAPHGQGSFALPAGEYEVHVSRGSEYEVQTRTLVVEARSTTTLDVTLARSFETPGWLSTDTHLHAQLSSDSSDAFTFKVAALAAEGIELPISTEHEALGDFGPAIRELGLEDFVQGVVGSEVTTSNIGHVNAFPLEPDLSLPGRGRIEWFGKTPAELFATLRANPGDPIVQVNHPRWLGIGGYFTAMGLDPATGLASDPRFSLDFDTVEIVNTCDIEQIERESLPDWFALLRRGERKVGTGGSDSHHAALGEVGYPRTYLRMPTDSPRTARVDDLRAAFRAGHVSISCGPYVEAKIGEHEVGDDVVVSGGGVDVAVRVLAPSWQDVDTLELLLDGRVVSTTPIPARTTALRLDTTVRVSVPADHDGFLIVRVRGDRPAGPWASHGAPWAITNPFFLDADGTAGWAPR
jgi:hypothetical protein